jgi:hypothetical protein
MEAAAYLADERNNEITTIQDAKRWITEDLHKAIEDVTDFEIDLPAICTGVDETTGWKKYVPGKVMTLSVKFKDEQVNFKNIPFGMQSEEVKV